MNKVEECKLLKIQTVILKVHIHCDGCKQEVKKLLQRIEGVYTVSIDAEQQKVTISGDVDSNTLIKKLARSGKHAELWSQKSNNQKQQPQQPQPKDANKNKNNSNNKGQGNQSSSNQALIQGLKAFKNQNSNMEPLTSEDEDFGDEDDDDFDDDEEDELGFLGDKMKQLNLSAAAAAAANAKKNGSNTGGVKKGGGNLHPNPAMGLKGPSVAGEPKGLNAAPNSNKMMMVNGAPLAGGNNGLMGLAALQGQGLQAQQQMGANFPPGVPPPVNPNSAGGGFGLSQQQMMNMRGLNSSNNNNCSSNNNANMLMNEGRYMQPQVMYNRSPQILPYTGYYYPYPYYHSPYVYHHSETGGHGDHLFSDDSSNSNSSSCVVM
ncbi:hypothetical protein Cni_G01725 [Canna indica]|uniref:HMA domain-containing protein n=1 Tax=Canna indica TaxID=4628 RepID=A0AAQ3JPS5_9LILI|nr:hypothetical protein Cni_G01725 [Canna indica]